MSSTREKLNALLYWTQPFRPEEEDWLVVTLRLRLRGEGLVMDGAMRQSQRLLFKPEMENLMLILNETGAAHISRPRLDDVVFEAYTAFADEMNNVILQCSRQGRSVVTDVTQVTEAARFLWERSLDMDYGSIELIRLDEMLPVLERVAARLRNG